MAHLVQNSALQHYLTIEVMNKVLNFLKVTYNIYVTGSYITTNVIDNIKGYTQVQSRNIRKNLGIRNIFIGLKLEFTCLSKETCES